MKEKVIKPPSSVPPLTGYFGLTVLLGLFFLWPQEISFLSTSHQAVVFLGIVFLFMAAYEILFPKTYRDEATGLDFCQSNDLSKIFSKDFFIKCLGLFFSLALVGLFYWVSDIYSDNWYGRFFEIIFDFLVPIICLVLVYFCFVHMYMKQPNDAYWQVGMLVLKPFQPRDWIILRDHFLGLAIKAFFLPLMFCYFLDDWNFLKDFYWPVNPSFTDYFSFFYKFLFFLDLVFVVIGYIFTARLFNAHIRWTETKAGGWVVCLLCYMPFWQIFGRAYFNYGGDRSWGQWLEAYPTIYVIWGSLILLLSGLYVLSEIQFGLRFSNLTYRGLVSHGTFRFTKHPAYITKNLSWWMIDIPFIAVDWTLALRNCLALLGINAIYYFRAKYEERCLETAPEYQKYRDFIEQNGLFSKLKSAVFRKNLKKV